MTRLLIASIRPVFNRVSMVPQGLNRSTRVRLFSTKASAATAVSSHRDISSEAWKGASSDPLKQGRTWHASLAAAFVLALAAVAGTTVGNDEFEFENDIESRHAEEKLRKIFAEAHENPYTVSIAAAQGLRCAMEDQYKIELGGRFAAVFDGHRGNRVSEYLRNEIWDEFHRKLVHEMVENKKNIAAPSISNMVSALRDALIEIEHHVLNDPKLACQGSTAVATIVHTSEHGKRTLISANVGDSRAIMSRSGRAVDLTEDHKPNVAREKARITQQGGKVEWDPLGRIYRVRSLALSRCIGDGDAKPIVSGEPDIRQFPIVDGEDEFVLMASDGLWDVMSSQEVVDFVTEQKDDVARDGMARAVAKEAMVRGTDDNVAVVLVWMN